VCRIESYFSCKFRFRNESFEMRFVGRSGSTRRTKLWKLCTAPNFRKLSILEDPTARSTLRLRYPIQLFKKVWSGRYFHPTAVTCNCGSFIGLNQNPNWKNLFRFASVSGLQVRLNTW
jgi:hypothetical protein